ncbi:tapasin-related protein-like [Heterodontus francisci]|uniref:tapasin-related protein-like n=1 Tax=Heterodontus francisci TaxID=7792 RepID=UPI00355BC9E7
MSKVMEGVVDGTINWHLLNKNLFGLDSTRTTQLLTHCTLDTNMTKELNSRAQRKMVVAVENQSSQLQDINARTPQGGMIKKFADETKNSHVLDNKKDSCRLQEDIDGLDRWAEKWQMEFNSEKCGCISPQIIARALYFLPASGKRPLLNMFIANALQSIRVLGIMCTVAIDAQFQVFQAPESTSALVGSNVTFYCTFPIFQDNSDVEVYWWKLGESNFLQTASDSRKKILRFKQGGASFHLLNISAQDSGVYYCGVRTLRSRIVNGTGSTISVAVPPTPLRIFPKVPELNSSLLDLVCKTDEFYPEALNLTWYKDGIEITIDIETTKSLNIDGLYEVSSLLMETQSVRSGAVYTCQVSHLTLPAPTYVTFTVAISNVPNFSQTVRVFPRFILSVLVLLLLTIIIMDHFLNNCFERCINCWDAD